MSTPTQTQPSTGQTSSIEGRVTKSTRRRSRASRRAPTTLLNTDTTNFRALVQQFTGISSGAYTTGAPVINFAGGGGYSEQLRQTPAVPYGHLQQYQMQQFQHQHHPQQQYQLPSEQFMNGNVEETEGFFFDGVSGQVVARSGSRESRVGGYLL